MRERQLLEKLLAIIFGIVVNLFGAITFGRFESLYH